VEFSREEIPKVYDALTMEGTELTLEVQQQLGDGIVRTIAPWHDGDEYRKIDIGSRWY